MTPKDLLFDSSSLFVAITGTTIGLIFIVLNIKIVVSLGTSPLKNYFRWMLLGAIIFFLGFTTEFFPDEKIWESVHHLLLIAAGIIFVITNFNLTDEIEQSIKPTKDENKEENRV